MSEQNQFSEVFRQEAEELLVEIEECILDIENDPNDDDAVNRLFRAMHTIKGSGSMFGFDDIANFTHHVETCLDEVRSGKVAINKDLIDLILASRDQIKTMLDGGVYDIETNASIIAALQMLMGDTDSGADGADTNVGGKQAESESDPELFKVSFEPEAGIFGTGMDPLVLIEDLASLGKAKIVANIDNIPLLNEIDPECCYMSWNVELTTGRGVDAIKDVFIFVESESEISIEKVDIYDAILDDDDPEIPVPKIGEILVQENVINNEQLGKALDLQRENKKKIGEILVNDQKVNENIVAEALQRQNQAKTKKESVKQESVRVSSDKLDRLINLVGELVITQAQLSEISADNVLAELTKPVEEVERLTGELRDSVLNIRMMPIGSQFNRFRRLVRDLCTELEKDVDLITEGAETEMDKTVIERLADPLVHLIRNSMDHGIEIPSDRASAGKPSKGTIKLSAAHKGANVVITIHDDGKGLDKDKLLNKAIEKGLVSPDVELSDKEIYSLILMPGFSTAQAVTNLSGRGVGMDVVKREIETLRGKVDISSELGAGTTIQLSLPLTLAIIDGLLVDVAGDKYVVPVSTVEECLEMNDLINALSKERNLIKVRGEMVPYVRLREIFGVPGDNSGIEEAVIVNMNDLRMGIVVDHIIGDYQTVIKSLGKMYEDVTEISGATIMGDGNVALILDVAGVMETAKNEEELILN